MLDERVFQSTEDVRNQYINHLENEVNELKAQIRDLTFPSRGERVDLTKEEYKPIPAVKSWHQTRRDLEKKNRKVDDRAN